jgi:putative ABC transport system permease protein
VLVVLEVALALVLLVGSGLLIRSFIEVLNIDPGFRTDRMVILNPSLPAQKYPNPEQRQALYYRLEETLRTLPGVISVGASSRIPLSSLLGANNVTIPFAIEGKPVPIGERPEADYRVVSADYFEAMGIPMIRGRKFTRGR